MTDHTSISKVSRLEVITTGARRRWTLLEKQRIVAESDDASGMRVKILCTSCLMKCLPLENLASRQLPSLFECSGVI